ncbi:hypothetical protein [Kribbella sp. NPDC049584]|uniref:hypothetical protein n=1 Tax=Kribbella sp. NPDC049584 TaxID=3154833 RepID=UPI00341B1CC8
MRTFAKYGGLMAAGVLTTGLLTSVTATAGQGRIMAPCTISVGSVTAGGDHRMQTFSATAPVTKIADKIVGKDIFADGQTRLSAAVRYGPGEGSELHTGQTVVGSVLYDVSYRTPVGGGTVSQKVLARVGPGWQNYRSLDRSSYGSRTTEWSLRNDGTMERRTVKTDANGHLYRHHDGWQSNFRGVKGLALISQTATYDTFLMTHSTGRLYTARFPVAGGHIMQSTVKPIRMSTWQVFETLVAAPCGQGSTVLAIDKDTGAGYLYSVGHANGLATVIKGLGKVPGSFTDPAYFSWHKYTDPKLFGE